MNTKWSKTQVFCTIILRRNEAKKTNTNAPRNQIPTWDQYCKTKKPKLANNVNKIKTQKETSKNTDLKKLEWLYKEKKIRENVRPTKSYKGDPLEV